MGLLMISLFLAQGWRLKQRLKTHFCSSLLYKDPARRNVANLLLFYGRILFSERSRRIFLVQKILKMSWMFMSGSWNPWISSPPLAFLFYTVRLHWLIGENSTNIKAVELALGIDANGLSTVRSHWKPFSCSVCPHAPSFVTLTASSEWR